MCCTLLYSRSVVHSQDVVTTIKNPLSSSCYVLPCFALCYFSRKYGKSCRGNHSVGKTPPPPRAQSYEKACLDSFNAMCHMVCSKNVCVYALFDVLWLTMTIVLMDPNLIDTNCNGHNAVP